MPVDTSLYGNIKPLDVQYDPNAITQAFGLFKEGRQIRKESDAKDAAAKNTDENGNLNRKAYISDLMRIDPDKAMVFQEHSAKMGEQEEAAKLKQVETAQKRFSMMGSALESLKPLSEEERAAAYPGIHAQLKAQGVISSEVPEQYRRDFFDNTYKQYQSTKDYLDRQKTQAEISNLRAQAGKTASETIKRTPDLAGQAGDPAALVPGLIPKEHQNAAFKEIDAAENTHRMSEAIMKAFEDSVKDTSGMGAIGSIVKTPRSSQALHQAMQPTFKDLEGTVRQAAMDNTFENITPNAMDSKADIETKRAALSDYLKSKLSAPTARAYGIDLSKYPTTAAYKSAAPRPAADSGIVSTANASAAPAKKPSWAR